MSNNPSVRGNLMETISLNQLRLEKKLKKLLVYLPVLLLLIILAATSIYKVNTGEAVVIQLFGSVARVVRDAGIHMKLPLVETATKVSLTRRHQIEYGYRTSEVPVS